MKIREIMSKNPVKTIVESTVSDAVKIMDEKNIGSILIEEDNRIIGIITERDILRKIVAKNRNPEKTQVKDIMCSPLITIDAEKTIEEANQLMDQNKIRRLPVEEDGNIVGIITLRDVSNNLKYSLGKSIIKDEGTNYYRPSYGKE